MKIVQPEPWWDRLFAPSSALAIITTAGTDGAVNAASFGTCTRVNHYPVDIAFTCRPSKDTSQNVLATGEFVVNLPPFEREILEAVRVVGLPFARGVNELEKAGLHEVPALKLTPPRIIECTRHFECVVEWHHEWSDRIMFVGRVVAASVDEDCVDAEGYVRWENARSAHFSGASYNSFVAAYEVMEVRLPYEGPEVEANNAFEKTIFGGTALIEPRKAGRPRDPEVHEAILRATAELLGIAGYANLSIEGVAQAAGVTRQSIYRRWTSKLALVGALLREVSESAPLPDAGSLRDDLRALYRLYARNLLTPGGPIIPALVAEAMHNGELASVVRPYIDERRTAAMRVFERAVARGEMRADAEPGMLIDLVSGYFWYLKLIRRTPVPQDGVERFVDAILDGITRKS